MRLPAKMNAETHPHPKQLCDGSAEFSALPVARTTAPPGNKNSCALCLLVTRENVYLCVRAGQAARERERETERESDSESDAERETTAS